MRKCMLRRLKAHWQAPSEPVKGPLFLLEDKVPQVCLGLWWVEEDSGDDMLAKFKKEVMASVSG